MKKVKGNSLRIGLIALLVAVVFAPVLVQGQNYTVGVKAGDWVKYGQVTFKWTGIGTEPSYAIDEEKIDWSRMDVLSVTGTTANLNWTIHFNNGTQTSNDLETDVNGSGSNGGIFLVASNLTTGDLIFPQTAGSNINQTVTKMYAGANRKVNEIGFKINVSGYLTESRITWDQSTGIMLELYTNQTDPINASGHEEYSFTATETNLWSANAFDLVQNNAIYIIAGIAVIVIILAATIVLRGRKTLSPQQPPPASAPPPLP